MIICRCLCHFALCSLHPDFEVFWSFRASSIESRFKYIERRGLDENGHYLISFFCQEGLETHHPLRFDNIDGRFFLAENTIQFAIGRSIVVCMDFSIFDQIIFRYFLSKCFQRQKVIVPTILLIGANSSCSGGDYLFDMRYTMLDCFPKSGFSCSCRT